jgi:hypothetical protein
MIDIGVFGKLRRYITEPLCTSLRGFREGIFMEWLDPKNTLTPCYLRHGMQANIEEKELIHYLFLPFYGSRQLGCFGLHVNS